MKAFENGLENGSKIVLGVALGLLGLAIIATMGLGIADGTGAISVPSSVIFAPYFAYIGLVFLGLVTTSVIIIIDIVKNDNAAEYIELMKP